MTAYLGLFGEQLSDCNVNCLVDTINPLGTLATKIFNANHACIAASFHENNPLKGNRYFEDKEWIAVLAGDLIRISVPWKMIMEILDSGKYEKLKNFNGYFSILALNREKGELFIVSDRRAQLQTFYLIGERDKKIRICVSTELSTFCRLPVEMTFNIEWLWEYLFFNYPIGQTTFLKNVKAMPPASILQVNIDSGRHWFSKYADRLRKKEHLLEGKESLDYAYDIFRNSIPKHFIGGETIACALTDGWDGRTNLSFCPNINGVVAYTYGTPGCSDLVEASKTVKALNIEHREILFDKTFEEKLPALIFDTVFLSSGMERITRATLLYAYSVLTEYGKSFPLVMSGISFDMQFRGHAHTPALISSGMAKIFSTGINDIDEGYWQKLMGAYYEPFRTHISKQIENLEKDYGKLSESAAHLSYMLYELSPKYFGSELAIAKHFTTLRVPAWDNDIIDLSYSIRNSTISFSQFLADYKRGAWKK